MPKQYREEVVYNNPDTVTDEHRADMYLLGCVDFRFWEDLVKFCLKLNLKIDLKLTEGAICHLDGGKHGLPNLRQGNLNWLVDLQELHGFHTVGMLIHDDCGAYKKAPGMSGKTPEEIRAAQMQDMEETEVMVRAALPNIAIRRFRMVVSPPKPGVEVVELSEVSNPELVLVA